MLEPQLKYDLDAPLAAEEMLRHALEAGGKLKDPSLIDLLYRRGRVRRELHKFPEALIDFRTALDGMGIFSRGDYQPPPYVSRANVYLETARVHTLVGDLQLAEHTLSLAAQEAERQPDYPNWADIHLEHARILVSQQRFEDAEDRLAAALETVHTSSLDAGPAAINLELGLIKGNTGEFETAMFCLREALNADPPGELRLRILVATGDLLWLQERRASALWHYHQVRLELEARVADGASHLVGTLELVVARIEQGRSERHRLYNHLLDRLYECLVAWDARGLVANAVEIAHLAATFGEYQRARALVVGLESRVAVAALAYHMLELSDPVEDDTAGYEHDHALYTQNLTDWEQELVDLYLD